MRFAGRISFNAPSVFLSKHRLLARMVIVGLAAVLTAAVQMRAIQRPALAIVDEAPLWEPQIILEGAVRVTVLGDSLGYGSGASCLENGFAHRIFDHIRVKRPGSTFQNLCIPHATTREVIASQLPLFERAERSLILIVAGSNDVRRRGPLGSFARDYERLIAELRLRDPDAVIVAAGLLDVSLARAVPPLAKPLASVLSAMNNLEIARIAAKHRAATIDYFGFSHSIKSQVAALMNDDGWHPSDDGHALMAREAFGVIDPFLA